MTEPRTNHEWESAMQDAARAFPYPPTPDIAGGVRRRLAHRTSPYRRLAWAAAAMLLAIMVLFTVPEVRAVVQEILRVGGIQIFLVEPTATITPAPTAVNSVLDLSGETTLADARSQVNFDILLPAYPDDLGEPDRVFLQDLGGSVVTLVWLQTDNPAQPKLALQILNERVVGSKLEPNDFELTQVGDQRAYWLTGEHVLAFFGPSGRDFVRIIRSNVLIWEVNGITYRLETDSSLVEAVRIAESLE